MTVAMAAAFAVLVGLFASAAPAAASTSPVPRAECRPGDRPDTQLQGQVPVEDRLSGRAEQGYSCNLDVIGTHVGRAFASFDSYEDCLYMPDQTWANAALSLPHVGIGTGRGIRVLDMSDPRHPRQTATLDAPVSRAPDESMAVNARRGLMITSSTADSLIDVYDLKPDCRTPKLVGTFDMAPALGHAGWFSPDGKTYWMSMLINDPATRQAIFSIDVTDPSAPKLLAAFETDFNTGGHNGWTSDDGRTTYACQLGIQKAADNRILALRSPQPGEPPANTEQNLISSFPIEGAACQDIKAVSYDGKPFLIANSEYTIGRALQKGPSPCGLHPENATNFGVPEIFDISNIEEPRHVGRMMLEVDDPKNCEKTMFDGDSTADSNIPGEIYDTHFCRPDRLHDPTILACARFLTGLEVYDIRDPSNPRELAYFRPGTLGESALDNPDWLAQPITVDTVTGPPVVRAARGEIWFGSYFNGLRVVKLPKSVYPFRSSLTCENDWYFNQYNPGHCPRAAPSPRSCVDRRAVPIEIGGLRGRKIESLTVGINGKRSFTQTGPKPRVRVPLAERAGRTARVRVVADLRGPGRVIERRSYLVCKKVGRSAPARKARVGDLAGETASIQAPAPVAVATPPSKAFALGSAPTDPRYLCVLMARDAANAVTTVTGTP